MKFQENTTIPKPLDPTAGFIQFQGHFILHFAYFLAIFLVRKPVDKTIECYVTDKVELEKYNQNNDNLWTKEVDGEDMLYFD